MKVFYTIIFLSLTCLLYSCEKGDPNNEVDEGTVSDNVYTSEEIGWTIRIPQDWDIISKDKMDKTTEKGMDAIKDLAGEVDYSGLKHLISFKKNDYNIFQSTSEPFKEEYEGEWEDNNMAVRDLIYITYSNRGIKVDTSSARVKIAGLDFNQFNAVIYNPKGEVLLIQEVYSRLVNGYDFGVNINYNDDEYYQAMLGAWKNSKFAKDLSR